MKRLGMLRKWNNEIDSFSPYFFFPFILILYFFVSLFDFGKIEYFEANRNILWAILVGMLSYLAAVHIVQKKNWMFPSLGLAFLKGKTKYFLYFLGFIGLVSYIIMLATGQIGITDESVRRHLDPKLNFLSSFLWFSVLFLICDRAVREYPLTKKQMRMYFFVLAAVLLLLVLMGYRTPIAIMCFTCLIVVHYTIRRVKLSWLLAFLFIVGLSLSLFGFFRVITEDQSKKFNSHEGPNVELNEEQMSRDEALRRKIDETPKWVRGLTEVSVTGRIVLSKLMEYADKHGYMYGKLHKGIFSTVLPGEQLSPRMQITEMVNSLTVDKGKYVTRPGRTTTPTLLGQFYVEAGYLAIIIGFALYGLILSMLYNQMKQSGFASFQTIAYAFITTIFMISIHTGLLDLLFLLMIGYAIVSSAIERTRTNI
ncbi:MULTISPECIES: oligosaccharide repeat unit polymerase [unclassified Geobacillus]|uniref:oligosaccharide repeat unit polymerase n=1 Tax=unclassified Geobacillus TaxID=2642459 RepID=UPI000BE40768|nr:MULTISPECIES: oligosaccharide repeat unit polymerase [unclassified Geobacillus]PDM39252.1 oligosaccharide repeat unit polymerase [Parageobacillus yumthangensis]PUF87848.1 oligosaccharide repeat unit polymerase [Geobacillus sp. LYN3]RDV22502.1 oligosaccharide repeat unit polymerase [Parageobacillus toebii]TXK88684.1 oligosaccharide repeat unit polymerase [Geobacillus sp. AYS3]